MLNIVMEGQNFLNCESATQIDTSLPRKYSEVRNTVFNMKYCKFWRIFRKMAAMITTEVNCNAYMCFVMFKNLFLKVLHITIRPQLTEIALV